jgi:hypothetical protein
MGRYVNDSISVYIECYGCVDKETNHLQMIKNINDMKNIISQGFKLGKQHKKIYCSNSNMKKDVIPRKLTHLNQCRPMDTKLMKKHLYYLLFKNEIIVHFS